MKKNTSFIVYCCICLACASLVACGGKKTVKPVPAPPAASKPATTTSPPTNTPAPAPTTSPPATPAPVEKPASPEIDEPGGYYLDDGPGESPPKNIDDIPNAVPKKEPLHSRTNRPYKALGATYKPMTRYQVYKERGIASWYGKRFHGKKTSNGEIYDMYSMTAAHTILPLPSYAKVTNPANGRSVIVRVNDRGPFKHSRIIDLSYAAAHKLGYIAKGSTLVEVEAIDPDKADKYASNNTDGQAKTTPLAATTPMPTATEVEDSASTVNDNSALMSGFFVQAGAFKNEANADGLINKLKGLDIDQNSGINKVYNNGLHRLKIGPFETKLGADKTAADIRKQLNVPAITITQ
jgi:rare lipoprotein A